MPKFDLYISPGDGLTGKLQSFLRDYFSDDDFEKLRKFGGRIQISVTAPFTDRKEQNDKLIIDENFITELKSDPEHSDYKLKTLTKKQLTKVASILEFPITSKATTKEIKNAINSHLNSAAKWEKISKIS